MACPSTTAKFRAPTHASAPGFVQGRSSELSMIENRDVVRLRGWRRGERLNVSDDIRCILGGKDLLTIGGHLRLRAADLLEHRLGREPVMGELRAGGTTACTGRPVTRITRIRQVKLLAPRR